MNNILPPSPHDTNIYMCPAFHIKGMCNTHCGKVGDHLPHSASQDNPLLSCAVDVKALVTPT